MLMDVKKYSFYKPSTLTNWIKSFPKMNQIVTPLPIGISLKMPLQASFTSSIADESTMQQKIDFLLNQIKIMGNRITKLNERIDETNMELIEKNKTINNMIMDVNNSIRTIIAGHIVGSFDVSFFGIIITLGGALIQIFNIPKTL